VDEVVVDDDVLVDEIRSWVGQADAPKSGEIDRFGGLEITATIFRPRRSIRSAAALSDPFRH
jgi:hypothetical protein